MSNIEVFTPQSLSGLTIDQFLKREGAILVGEKDCESFVLHTPQGQRPVTREFANYDTNGDGKGDVSVFAYKANDGRPTCYQDKIWYCAVPSRLLDGPPDPGNGLPAMETRPIFRSLLADANGRLHAPPAAEPGIFSRLASAIASVFTG